MKALTLRSARFRAERERRWRELEALIVRAEKEGVRALSPGELSRLPALYRAVLASLSVARHIAMDRNLVAWLENLCQRSYFVVYGTRHLLGEAVRRFVVDVFPRTFRQLSRHVLLSALFMLGGGATAYFATRADPERYFTFIDAQMVQHRSYSTSVEELRKTLYSDWRVDSAGDSDSGPLAAFASFLFTHNARVTLLCFALGFALGVPTFLLLVMNGFALGAMSALFVDKGLGLDWFGWILPHGVTELFAVVLGGAGGLELGHAVAFPGERTRKEELARRGRDAGVLAIGAIAMLVLAAAIEGFFRQMVDSVPVRYGLATTTAIGWIVYLGWPRRKAAT
ncbi:MAG: stage II sporulation protein M [Planctomycetes bacterium]|nr:stage II sporulation protein M [Planctomycetota bacterium]